MVDDDDDGDGDGGDDVDEIFSAVVIGVDTIAEGDNDDDDK